MSTRQKRQTRLTGFIIPCLCLATLGYFAHHAQTGRYNIHTKSEMNERAEVLKQELVDIREHRARLEKKVAQLTDGTMEKDALDEAVRANLGMAAPNEIIILH